MRFTITSFLLVFGLGISTVFGQQSQIQRSLGGSSSENSYGIERTPDGGYIAVGYTESFGSGKKDVLLVKTDGMGQVEWSKAYGDKGDDVGWNITVARDSGFVITGTTNSINSEGDALIFKTDKNGNFQWARTLASDSTEDGYNVIRSLFHTGYYVTGFVQNDTNGSEAFLARISSSGGVQWMKKFGSPGSEEAYGLAEDTKGNVIVCGLTDYDSLVVGGTTGSQGTSDAFMAKFDASGSMKWMYTYGSNKNDVAWDVKVDKDRYIMVGWTKALTTGDNDMLVIATDTNGSIRSASQIGTTGDDRAFDVVVKPTNPSSYAIVGYSEPMPGDREVAYVDILNNGNVGNISLIGSTGKDGHWPTDIALARDNGFMILSTTNSFSSSNDWYFIKTDKDGGVNCNNINEPLNQTPLNLSSTSFGSVFANTASQTPTLKTTTVTSSLSDTTECCRLSIELPSKSVSICEGQSTAIGLLGTSGLAYNWYDENNNMVSTSSNPTVSPSKTTKYKVVVSSKDTVCKKDSAEITVIVNAYKKFASLKDTSFCIGDSAKIMGSDSLVSFSWMGTHVNSNNKQILVKDNDTIYFSGSDVNSCTYTDTMIVSLFSLPTFSLGNDTTVCEVVGVTLMGPANMASYDWNSGEASTQSYKVFDTKTYTLDVVDNNGCAYSDMIQVFTNPSSPFSLGADDTFCEGGVYTILGPGALGDYIWNDTASTLQNIDVTQPGTYHLTAFNSFGCPSSDTITLYHRGKPVFSLGADKPLCTAGSVQIPGPEDMKEYFWNTNSKDDTITVSISGDYWLRVTDKYGCQYTDTINIFDVSNPSIDLGNDTVICDTDSLLLTPGTGFAKYTWSTGEDTESIWVKAEDEYSVTVTDNNGCNGSSSIQVDTMDCGNDGIREQLRLLNFGYHPVPASDKLNLTFESMTYDQMTVELRDIAGKVISSEQHMVRAGLNNMTVDVSSVAPGTYFVLLGNSNGTASLKILVE